MNGATDMKVSRAADLSVVSNVITIIYDKFPLW
jgi:hypothetical protein